jgi:hypothetical protein
LTLAAIAFALTGREAANRESCCHLEAATSPSTGIWYSKSYNVLCAFACMIVLVVREVIRAVDARNGTVTSEAWVVVCDIESESEFRC